MLHKRANILFTQDHWDTLSEIARSKKTSVGFLVRDAVSQVYLANSDLSGRQKAIADIKKLRSTVAHSFSTKEIRTLIKDGRK